MKDEKKKLIGSLEKFMSEYGYSQRDIAKKLHVHESTVSRWLNGGNIINQHRFAIDFLISGELPKEKQLHPECAITGLNVCPFADSDGATQDLLKLILKMTPVERAGLLTHILSHESGERLSAG